MLSHSNMMHPNIDRMLNRLNSVVGEHMKFTWMEMLIWLNVLME